MAVARPEISTQPLGGSFGRAIEPAPLEGSAAAPAASLGDLDPAEVARLLRRHGALLFRRFGASRDELVALSERSSRGFSSYQGGFFRDRQPVGAAGTLLTVTGSQEGFAIPLHGEMYYTGRRPAILWFFCERPAAEGGETTLCDGEAIAAALSETARRLFTTRRVRYRRELPDGAWQAAFQTGDLAEVERYCRENDTRLEVDPATGAVATEHLAWAIVPGGEHRPGRPATFINNVVSLYMGELSLKRGTAGETIRQLAGARFPITVRMEDGAPVPGAVIKELLALDRRLAAAVAWSAGDALMIDNTRVLHGRTAFRGARDVYVRMAEPAL